MASGLSGTKAPRKRARTFGLVTASNFFFFLSLSFYFLLPRFVESLGGTPVDIGLVQGAMGITSMVAIPLVGSLVDRRGRSRFLLVGSVAWSVLCLGYLGVDSLGTFLYALRAAQGLAFALAFTAASTLIADLTDKGNRAFLLGLYGSFVLATQAIGPSVAEELVGRWGFRAFFWTSAGLSVLAALLALGVRDPRRRRPIDAASLPLRRVLFGHGIAVPVLSNLLHGVCFGAVIHFLAAYVPTLGIPHVKIFFIAHAVCAIGSRFTVGPLADRLGRQAILLPAFLALALALRLLSSAGDRIDLAVAGAVFGFSHGLIYPVLNALVIDRVESLGAHGKATSLFIVSFNIGVVAAAFLLGPLARAWGYPALYGYTSFVALLALALFAAHEALYRAGGRGRTSPKKPR